jgi:hypothetical protein
VDLFPECGAISDFAFEANSSHETSADRLPPDWPLY